MIHTHTKSPKCVLYAHIHASNSCRAKFGNSEWHRSIPTMNETRNQVFIDLSHTLASTAVEGSENAVSLILRMAIVYRFACENRKALNSTLVLFLRLLLRFATSCKSTQLCKHRLVLVDFYGKIIHHAKLISNFFSIDCVMVSPIESIFFFCSLGAEILLRHFKTIFIEQICWVCVCVRDG